MTLHNLNNSTMQTAAMGQILRSTEHILVSRGGLTPYPRIHGN